MWSMSNEVIAPVCYDRPVGEKISSDFCIAPAQLSVCTDAGHGFANGLSHFLSD